MIEKDDQAFYAELSLMQLNKCIDELTKEYLLISKTGFVDDSFLNSYWLYLLLFVLITCVLAFVAPKLAVASLLLVFMVLCTRAFLSTQMTDEQRRYHDVVDSMNLASAQRVRLESVVIAKTDNYYASCIESIKTYFFEIVDCLTQEKLLKKFLNSSSKNVNKTNKDVLIGLIKRRKKFSLSMNASFMGIDELQRVDLVELLELHKVVQVVVQKEMVFIDGADMGIASLERSFLIDFVEDESVINCLNEIQSDVIDGVLELELLQSLDVESLGKIKGCLA